MLIVWTAASADMISKTVGAALKLFRPDVPPHKIHPYEPGELPPKPAAGEVVLVCGMKPLEQLRAAGLAPKNRTLTSMREMPIRLQGAGCYMTTYDPFTVNSEPDKKDVIDWDVRLAIRLMTTGGLLPVIGEYQWVNSYQPMIDRIEAKFAITGKAVDVAADTETMTFYPWYKDKDLISISFTDSPGMADVLYLGPLTAPVAFDPSINLFEQVKWLMTTSKVKLRLSNGKYDMIWIAEKWGIECTNFKFDNMLVGSLLDENRSNGLNLHAKIFTNFGGYDDALNTKYDKGQMEKVPLHDLLPYAGGDTDAAFQVADIFRDQLLGDPPLANFYVTILHPAARAFEKLERRGVLVDQAKYKELGHELEGVIDKSQTMALSLLPNRMTIKYRDRILDQVANDKSPLLPSILKDYFFSPMGLNLKPKEFTAKTKEPSMAKSHLRQFADVPEAAFMLAALTEMDSAAKMLSTFVHGFLKHLRPDGRLHPTYFLAHGEYDSHDDDDSGTVTGRLSAKGPAIQTLVKKNKWAKKLRACYPAPPGKAVLSVDYSQGELKVVACIANEEKMLDAYLKGLDLHAVTGAKLGGVSLEEFLPWQSSEDAKLSALYDKYRSNAKPANFGLIFGMGPPGFQAYAWANYGLKLSDSEAQAIHSAFFEMYPGLLDYHDHQKKLVKINKMVRSPLGRIRHLPMIEAWDREIKSRAERQSINSPVQSTLTDMMCWSIAFIEASLPQVETVAMIHDALIAYVPEQEVHQCAVQISEIMSNLPFETVGWKPQLKFTVDAEAGLTLGSLKKVMFAA